ncbi:hypothetical protein TSOC_000309, partial [Tetrabaena socialis]
MLRVEGGSPVLHGVSPPRPSLLRRGRQLVGRVLGAPRAALRQVTKRLARAQRLWWRLEDVVVDGSKLAAKVALRAARPVLIDEINQEKRLMTAAQLRRLEVEEWDKQRMKNFYLSSFGGLRWFDQMEQALHNPLFIESRGWTDPVENWVGLNRTYMRDLARPGGGHMADVGPAALALKESELGRRLSPGERARVLARGADVAGGLLPTSNKDPAAAALAAAAALLPGERGGKGTCESQSCEQILTAKLSAQRMGGARDVLGEMDAISDDSVLLGLWVDAAIGCVLVAAFCCLQRRSRLYRYRLGVDDEELQEVLRSFADLVAEAIHSVLELPQFRHVEVVQVDAAEGAPSSLSIGFDAGASDAEVDLDKLQGRLDISGLLLGSAGLPEELAAVAKVVVQDDEEGVTELQLSDPALDKELSGLLRRARLERLYEDWYSRVEPALVPALDAASANVEASETPLDPLDVVRAIVAQLVQVA